MSESKNEVLKGIEGLTNAYAEFIDAVKIDDYQKENLNENSYAQYKKQLINLAATKLQYHSSVAQVLLMQDLGLEINALKKEIEQQTIASKRASRSQRWLTRVIILIGGSSLFLTLFQMFKTLFL